MKIILLTIGKTTDRAIAPLIDRYVERIRHFAPFEYRVLPDVKVSKSTTEDRQKELESEAFLACIASGDRVILLDEHGKTPTSRHFAQSIDRMMSTVPQNIVFIIGGPYGFSPAIYARANDKLALSAMTLTHEMARLFFAEQLYRAFTILRGLPYHHD